MVTATAGDGGADPQCAGCHRGLQEVPAPKPPFQHPGHRPPIADVPVGAGRRDGCGVVVAHVGRAFRRDSQPAGRFSRCCHPPSANGVLTQCRKRDNPTSSLALGVSAALPMHIPKVVHAQATKAGVLPHRVQVPAKERPEALASDTVLAYQVAARMYVTPNATTWRNSWRREPNSNWLPEPFWKISRPRPRRSVQPWSVRIERS